MRTRQQTNWIADLERNATHLNGQMLLAQGWRSG